MHEENPPRSLSRGFRWLTSDNVLTELLAVVAVSLFEGACFLSEFARKTTSKITSLGGVL